MRILDRGLESYRETWDFQKNEVERMIEDPSYPESIIFVEHPPVYTLGFHGNENNLLVTDRELQEMKAECIRIERGGDITFHGPGQLVVYPLINLRKHNLGVKQYVHLLEDSVIETLRYFGVCATSNDKEIGVWIDYGKPEARKICAIGVKVTRGVTMHGLALNVNTDLRAFQNIVPCGITDKRVTSLGQELNHPVSLPSVKSLLSTSLLTRLNNQISD